MQTSIVLCLGLLCATTPPCPAADGAAQTPSFLNVQVGVGGQCKLGLWTQAVVTLRGGSRPATGQVSVVLPDGDGIETRFTAPEPCRLLPSEETRVSLLVRPGRHQMWLRAELHVADRLEAEALFRPTTQADASTDAFPTPLDATRPLYLVLGADRLPVEQFLREGGYAQQTAEVAQAGPAAILPDKWLGYEGFEVVVLCTGEEPLNKILEKSKLDALDQWVTLGGTLIFCVGARAEQVLATGSPLARFAPGKLNRMVNLRQTGALESYARSSTAIPVETEFRVPHLDDLRGGVEAQEADLPLVVRTPRGIGQVVFLAADLDRGPIAAWKGRAELFRRLLALPRAPQEDAIPDRSVLHHGVFDLAGQLRQALDHFPSVRPVPFWLVTLFLVSYLLLIGPIDYFFLRKVVGRMQLTWVTFPVLVLGVSAGAYFLADRVRGDRTRLNQAELIDVDLATGLARGTLWANLFAPHTAAYDLSVRPAQPGSQSTQHSSTDRQSSPEQFHCVTAWLGLPGTGLGGMSSSGPGVGEVWPEGYRFSPDLRAMQAVPLLSGSTKSFTARWSGKTDVLPQVQLADDGQVLSGTLVNRLPFGLAHGVLVYRQWAYELGDLPPGQSVQLGPTSKRSELKTFLTGRKLVQDSVGEKYRQVTTPWDRDSADVPLILRTMMFHEAAGGRRYTGLPNGYQSFVDFSMLLPTNRAILVARLPAEVEGSRLLAAGQPLAQPDDLRVTIVRFLAPVTQTGPTP